MGVLVPEEDLPEELRRSPKAVPADDLPDSVRLEMTKEAPASKELRPRLSIGEEFVGGLRDFSKGVGTNATLADRLLSPLGLLRAAASPLAPLTNLATSIGETVRDATTGFDAAPEQIARQLEHAKQFAPGLYQAQTASGKAPTTLSDLLGLATSYGLDFAMPGAVAKGAGLLKPVLPKVPFLKLRPERAALVDQAEQGQRAAVAADAQAARNKSLNVYDAEVDALNARQADLQRVADDVDLGAIAQQQSTQAAGDIEKQAATAKAQQELAEVSRVEDEARNLSTGAKTAEEVGGEYQATYKTKAQASRERFNTEYDDVLDRAKQIETSSKNTSEAAKQFLNEESRVLPTKADAAAYKLKGAVDAETDAYKALKAQFSDPNTPEAQKTIQGIMQKNGIVQFDPAKRVTLDRLIVDRQKLKGLIRAAQDSGQDDLARQFKVLRDGIEADLAEHGDITARLAKVDKAYATKHAPYYSYGAPAREAADTGRGGIVDRLVPKASDKNRIEKLSALDILDDKAPVQKAWINQGVFEAEKSSGGFGKGIVKYWDEYSEPGDAVLKSVLGDKYNHWKDIVERLRTSKPKSIQETLRQTVAQIEKNTAATVSEVEASRIGRMKTLQGQLDEAPKYAKDIYGRVKDREKIIAGERADRIAAIEQESKEKLEKIYGKGSWAKIKERAETWGTATIVHGLVGTGMGLASGGATVVTGGLLYTTGAHIARLVREAPELARRLLRSVPGTAQASATARQVQNFLQKRDEDER